MFNRVQYCSPQAQQLTAPITSASKLQSQMHELYLLKDGESNGYISLPSLSFDSLYTHRHFPDWLSWSSSYGPAEHNSTHSAADIFPKRCMYCGIDTWETAFNAHGSLTNCTSLSALNPRPSQPNPLTPHLPSQTHLLSPAFRGRGVVVGFLKVGYKKLFLLVSQLFS